MLYVVLTSRESRVIIIDEPQSFLHPGAVRKLFDVLKDFPQHQYSPASVHYHHSFSRSHCSDEPNHVDIVAQRGGRV